MNLYHSPKFFFCWPFLVFLFIPFLLSAQNVSITFEVNMSYQINAGNFDHQNEFVDVAGTFNEWGETLIRLNDEDADSVYSVIIGGFTPGNEIQYKFRMNGVWDDREEFPGAGNNRTYTVQPDSNYISVWYNNETSPDGSPEADFSTASTHISVNSLVQFQNRSSGNITTWKWTFEGGIPSESTEKEPAVRYTQPGSYDVQLIVSNDTEADTLLRKNYLRVSERESGEIKWWNESVFYEIFVRSFYDSDGDGIGDFNGLTQKLDYLNDGDPDTKTDLGITGIWLMPIHDSPFYHGYDVTDYRSINPDYGTMEDFRHFLDEAHARGIKVIIDFVMNHSSDQHPWFQKSAAGDPDYRNFYRWSDSYPEYDGPWGQQVWHPKNGDYYYGLFWSGMPDLNYGNPAVKDSMFAISDFWISDIGVDGFRQDAVLYIHEDGSNLKNTPETLQFWSDFNANLKASNTEAMVVGEAWEPTDIVLNYITDNRLDYAFEFDLAQSILNGVKNEEPASVLSQMQKVYDSYPFLQYGTFLTNHDQNRTMNVLGRNVDKAKLAASLYLTLPGIPYLYYGEEVGMLGQKPDEDIRLPMQWNNEANAGFSSVSPWRNPNSNYAEFNVADMQNKDESLFSHYRSLIQLRNNTELLRTGQYEAALSSAPSVFAYTRFDGENLPIVVVTNFSDKMVQDVDFSFSWASIPGNSIGLLEAHSVFGEGYGFGLNEQTSSGWSMTDIYIQPFSTIIYQISPGGLSVEGKDEINTFRLLQNYPNPFNPTTNITFVLPKADKVLLKVFDSTGRLIATLADQRMNAGSHTIQFDASRLASGIYFYSLEAESFHSTQKMTLIK